MKSLIESVKILNDTIARYKKNMGTKETEEDIRANADFDNASKAVDELTKEKI